MGTLANFGTVCFYREKKNHVEIITYNPSIYTIDHPDLTVSNFMENAIGLKWVQFGQCGVRKALVQAFSSKLFFLFLNQNICCGF